jgi:hypothetical protein
MHAAGVRVAREPHLRLASLDGSRLTSRSRRVARTGPHAASHQ